MQYATLVKENMKKFNTEVNQWGKKYVLPSEALVVATAATGIFGAAAIAMKDIGVAIAAGVKAWSDGYIQNSSGKVVPIRSYYDQVEIVKDALKNFPVNEENPVEKVIVTNNIFRSIPKLYNAQCRPASPTDPDYIEDIKKTTISKFLKALPCICEKSVADATFNYAVCTSATVFYTMLNKLKGGLRSSDPPYEVTFGIEWSEGPIKVTGDKVDNIGADLFTTIKTKQTEYKAMN